MTEIDNLPPIIGQMINNMNNKNNDLHIRDNYAAMLEKIIVVCQDQINRFKKEQTKTNFEVRTKKKKG